MESGQSHESFYYVKYALQKLKQYWYFFALSVVGFGSLAYFVNWYLQPVYEVGSLILIDEWHSSDPSDEFMKSFSIFTPTSDINKEIRKLKSFELIHQALEQTHAEVSYNAVTNTIRKIELYDDCPFRVVIDREHVQPLGVKFDVVPVSNEKFRLHLEKPDGEIDLYNYAREEQSTTDPFGIDQEYKYGDTIITPALSLIVYRNLERNAHFANETRYQFKFNDLNRLMYDIQKELTVEQVGKDIQAISIKLKVKRPQRGIDFINELTKAYVLRNLDKKSSMAENSIKYIDREIASIEGTLTENESDLQKFRSAHKVMEMKTVSDQAFKNVEDLESQKAELESRDKYYNYVLDNVDGDHGKVNLAMPSSMGVNDPVLAGMIEEYLKLSIEKNNMVEGDKTMNPYFKTIQDKMMGRRKALMEYIQYMVKTNDVLLASVDSRLNEENSKITRLPGTERELGGIERKKGLNDEVYKYMLRKKADAQIARGANLPDNDILEGAKLTQMDPVAPKKAINYLVAIFAGFTLPFFFLGIKTILNNAILDEQMLLSVTRLTLIGRVYRKSGQKELSILEDSPKSPVSESIRSLRTNVEFFASDQQHKVILFTSSMSGEGKSFCSLNLAHSLSLAKRKTVIIDFDLRRPNAYEPFNNERPGLVAFLNGDTDDVDAIIAPTGIPGFDCISVGDVPENPAELVDSERTQYLIDQLKVSYDYVVIDTAPAGLVSETFVLMKYSDMKIIVARKGVTLRSGLSNLVGEIKSKEMEDVYCLLNDVDVTGTVYGRDNKYFNKKA
ncbi:MAG: polysaccharide biosynthesis tyrosine autokinase [Flavobacteriales bacterium]|nr:polysaccharide biosynthesis tyrosine autokinase [Flavobacteriales bacterium]MCB9447762.1 polysaccharide biosynthesis tyrosine autokinase [Flavobacteriales bacterium]